jgi:hypothetical protein
MLNNFNSFNGDSSLKRIKRPFSGVAFLKWNWMLIPSKSKAKRNYYGVSSSGTDDYRHGANVRLLKQFESNGNEVLKKKEHLCSGSRTIFSRSVVHSYCCIEFKSYKKDSLIEISFESTILKI